MFEQRRTGFDLQDHLANELVQHHGFFAVHKVARAGCSMSLAKASCESGKKVAIFSPTIRILKQIEEVIPTITGSKPRIAPILSNPELCTKLELDPRLKFQFRLGCGECEFKGKPKQCVFQDLLINDFDLYCLTYSKLQALQKSSSEEAKLLLEKLRKCDVIILDEFTTAVVRDIPTIALVTRDGKGRIVRTSEHLMATFEKEFKRSDKIISEDLYEHNTVLLRESGFWGIVIQDFLAQFENINQNGIYKNIVHDSLPEDGIKSMFQYGWNKITALTKDGRDTAALQDVFLMAFAEEVVVAYEDGVVKVTPKLENALGYIREFCQTLGEEKLILVVDSYQPSMNLNSVFKRTVAHKIWGEYGDPLGTNKEQVIVCDTAHWGALDFLKDKSLQGKVRSFIHQIITEFPPKQVLVVATNKRMVDVVNKWHLPKDARVTWFRSDWMRGVSVEGRRIMLCVGGPYIPRKSYDASAGSFRIESFAKELELLDEEKRRLMISRCLRLDDTRSEFINAIGRVKDPQAKERSLVFTLGMQEHEVRLLQKQEISVSIPQLTKPLRKGGMFRDGVWIARLWLRPRSYTACEVKDLPLIARIIRCTKTKISVPASEIAPDMTDVVVKTAKYYSDELGKYRVEIVEKRGGVSFHTTFATMDHFSEEEDD